jgi:hypothetical protein
MSMRIGIEDIEGADGVLPGRWYGIIHDSPDLIRGFILGTWSSRDRGVTTSPPANRHPCFWVETP